MGAAVSLAGAVLGPVRMQTPSGISYEPDGPRLPYKPHALANLFPMMEVAQFDDLLADIAANGVQHPVVLYEGAVLDGRNRYMAAAEAKVPFPVADYIGSDPLGYVISVNLKRRHLSESQRARIAAEIAKLPKGANQHTAIAAPSQAEAAVLLNVSQDSIQRAAVVRDHAVPELDALVKAGTVAVSAAAEVARLPEAEQRETVAAGPKEIQRRATAVRRERQVAGWQERVDALLERARQAADKVSGPSVKLSIAAHYIAKGVQPHVAETIAAGVGVSVRAIERAVYILSIPPEQFEAEEEQAATVIGALMAGDVHVGKQASEETIWDQAEPEREENIWRKGWIAAVLGRPCASELADPEADIWTAGWRAFEAELNTFEQRAPVAA
jgi:hypothetical protein